LHHSAKARGKTKILFIILVERFNLENVVRLFFCLVSSFYCNSC